MRQQISCVTVLVHDYDAAIAYYRDVLGFRLREDTRLSPDKRWVRVAPPGSDGCALLLARARGREQEQAVGRQAGGRVFLFRQTDDFWRDYHAFVSRRVHFCEAPREEPYGMVAVFDDLFGNRWDLLQLTNGSGPPTRQTSEESASASASG